MSESVTGAQFRSIDLTVLVVSCDKYRDLWRPFFHCFHKYWPDCPFPVCLGSNHATFDDPRVRTIAIGDDQDYASNLLAMLEQVPTEWVLIWLEDRFLRSPLDTARLLRNFEFAREHGAGYVRPIGCAPWAPKASCGELGELPRGGRYRVSMTVAFWRKDVLARLLKAGETAWDFERLGSRRSDGLDAGFFALTHTAARKPLIDDVHLIIKGHLLRDSIDFLFRQGLLDQLRHRPLQSWRSVAYVRLRLGIGDRLHLLHNKARLLMGSPTR